MKLRTYNTRTYYYSCEAGHARYWFDRNLRLWTIHAVTQPNENGDQISDAEYECNRALAEKAAERLANHKTVEKFTSVEVAVAHYMPMGYMTRAFDGEVRWLVNEKDQRQVVITKIGFREVEAVESALVVSG